MSLPLLNVSHYYKLTLPQYFGALKSKKMAQFSYLKGDCAVKKSRYTEEKIAFALRQMEMGISVEEVCRKMGISSATFYQWRKKYGGFGPSELQRLRQLEDLRVGMITKNDPLSLASFPVIACRELLYRQS